MTFTIYRLYVVSPGGQAVVVATFDAYDQALAAMMARNGAGHLLISEERVIREMARGHLRLARLGRMRHK